MSRGLVVACAALLAYAQAGYALLLALLVRILRLPPPVAEPREAAPRPHVALIVAAHDEASVIEAKVRNARGLDWDSERLTVVVASDGSTDDTVARARAAGADLVRHTPVLP